MSTRNRRKPQPPKKTGRYRAGLYCRLFVSVLLVLSALYIRENAPVAATWARQQLCVSADVVAVWESIIPRFAK